MTLIDDKSIYRYYPQSMRYSAIGVPLANTLVNCEWTLPRWFSRTGFVEQETYVSFTVLHNHFSIDWFIAKEETLTDSDNCLLICAKQSLRLSVYIYDMILCICRLHWFEIWWLWTYWVHTCAMLGIIEEHHNNYSPDIWRFTLF